MCGCQERQEKLNMWHPGLGDKVKIAIRVTAVAIAVLTVAYVWRSHE